MVGIGRVYVAVQCVCGCGCVGVGVHMCLCCVGGGVGMIYECYMKVRRVKRSVRSGMMICICLHDLDFMVYVYVNHGSYVCDLMV